MIATRFRMESSVVVRIVQPDSGAIRAANRASVANVLRRAGSATHAEPMSRTGLSPRLRRALLVRATGLPGVVRRWRVAALGDLLLGLNEEVDE
jgi:hypothetical protein